MKRAETVGRASRRALPPTIFAGGFILLFAVYDVMRRGTRAAEAAVIGFGLTAVIFFTYFILGLAGYRLRGDGAVRVPWPYAWLVVLLVVLGIGAVAYLALRSLPQSWR
jgi:hypothetical protein